MNRIIRALALTLLVTCTPVQGKPVPEDERLPLDLRRTTLVVRDIDRSIALYRDALGMTVSYDNMIRTPRAAKTDQEAEISRRLTFLQANDDFIGVLGLLEYRKPRKQQPVSDLAFEPGNHVFRAELQCSSPETRLASEEWTKYYHVGHVHETRQATTPALGEPAGVIRGEVAR